MSRLLNYDVAEKLDTQLVEIDLQVLEMNRWIQLNSMPDSTGLCAADDSDSPFWRD